MGEENYFKSRSNFFLAYSYIKRQGYQLFEVFYENKHIDYEDFPVLSNHICAKLTSWSPNRSFYYEQYNYLNKLYIVCNWRQERGLFPLKDRRGKAICNNELVIFFENEKHKNCACSTV